MRTKYIQIQIAYESDEEFEALLAAIKESLPKNQSLISVEQWLDKPKGWKGFNDESI
tara:strand:+ start:2311 stop:2481 length:171 start_codon:yes stop_codon:yes gene_type:complete